MKTAIIGVGNKLMGDEGVGVHAVEYLRKNPPSPPFTKGGKEVAPPFTKGGTEDDPPPLKKGGRGGFDNIDILDAGTGGMALFHLLERYERVIIIDAADFGGRPGDVRSFVINPPSPPFTKGGKEVATPFTKGGKEVATPFTKGGKEVAPPFEKGGTGGISLTPDSTQVSLHGTSLAGILQLAEKLGTKMPKITIIAVQPEYIGCKLELSPAVKRSLVKIRKAIGERGQT